MGELTGSRHSSKGSSRVDSHSKVDDVIMKCCLNESGLRGIGESSRGEWVVRLRLRVKGRRESEAAISEEVMRWWRRRKRVEL